MSDTVTISRGEYEELIDIRDATAAMREVMSGTLATVPEAEVDAYLAAATALQFWRKRSGLSQQVVADQVGISQPYLAQVEHGKRVADVRVYRRLAQALKLRLEDVVPE